MPIPPVDPDPRFTAELRARLERAVLRTTGDDMTTALDSPAHTLGSYLAVDNARRALDFYVEAFDARRRGEPYVMDDGRVDRKSVV